MAVTIKNINERIADKGFELVKGDGYFYFSILPGFADDTQVPASVYANSVRDLSLSKWLEAAETVEAQAQEILAPTANEGFTTPELQTTNNSYDPTATAATDAAPQTRTEAMNDNTPVTADENTAVNSEELVASSQANLDAAIAADTAAKEAAKEAAKNHKAALAYEKTVGDSEKDNAAQTVAGWAAEAERTKAVAAASKEAVKTARAELAQAKKDAKAGGAGKATVEKIEQNGQVKPRPGSKSGQLWDIFDAASAERGSACAVGDVLEQCMTIGMTEGSVRSAYSHWRKFHGVEKGRIQSVTAPDMSDEKRAEAIAKVSEQLEKAQARVAALTEKLAALQPADTAEEAAE